MRNRAGTGLAVSALALTLALPARADEPGSPRQRTGLLGIEGRKVRLRVRNNARVEGTLVEADGDGLRLRRTDGTVQSFDLNDLRQVEFSERRSRVRGTAYGALTGAVMGGIIGLSALAANTGATRSPDGLTCYDRFGSSSPCAKASDIPAMAGGCAMIGALIGVVWPGHHYTTVRPERLTLRVAPARGGVAVAATVGF
jgi:hypothetical protein